MKKHLLTATFLFFAITIFAQSGIYVGGHFRRDSLVTVPALKESGFTYAILFNVEVEDNGDLKSDGVLMCSDGKYVFDKRHPTYAKDVAALKSGKSTIRRVETCIGGWGSQSYFKIKDLVASQGTGENSILYKNFKALKEAVPTIEAINNDDEHCYDAESASKFHIMLYDLGFKTTMAPYQNKSFWESFASKINQARPGAVDRVNIQCYDGGAGNNPKDWHIGGITLHAGMLHFNSSQQIKDQMTKWKKETPTEGGFLWVYNANDFNLKNHAAAITSVFGGGELTRWDEMTPHITLFTEKNFLGDSVNFEIGKYDTFSIEEAQKFSLKNVQSIKVREGITIELFKRDQWSGSLGSTNQSIPDYPASNFSNNPASFIISPDIDSGLNEKQMFLRNKSTGQYLALKEDKTTKEIPAVQKKDHENSNYRTWNLTIGDNGAYRITSKATRRTLEVANGEYTEETSVVQNLYKKEMHQEFIIKRDENSNAYKLIPLHSLMYLGIEEGKSNLEDALVVQKIDASDPTTDWELIDSNGNSLDTISAQLVKFTVKSDRIDVYSPKEIINHIEIFDIYGRLTQYEKHRLDSIDISNLSPGIYIIQVSVGSSNSLHFYKFIKQQ